MGIPSYFSYVVKNHPEIIQMFIQGGIAIDNLYIDANSIIYDAFHSMTSEETSGNLTKILIEKVICKIKEYIKIVAPTKGVIVSFDGVAPMAKLEQQRTRRFKSLFQTTISNNVNNLPDPTWSTASITPGTSFMKDLNRELFTHFNKEKGFGNQLPIITISTSDDAGEGEHKICKHIRDNPSHKDQTTVIYGLDADLIMLAINHLPLCKQIYLFRETPDFIKSIDSQLEPNHNYLFDIRRLADNIVVDMQQEIQFSSTDANRRLYDYIFMCFLLGNDFLPHFPAINIRTGGVDKLLRHYKNAIGSSNRFMVDIENKKIIWKNVRLLFESLAAQEHAYISAEHATRDKRERQQSYAQTPSKKVKSAAEMTEDDRSKAVLEQFQNIPCVERSTEKYISPDRDAWEHRYYVKLVEVEPSEERVRQVCVNYLEGLEWTFKYYISDCPDWRWKYKYHYPPLLSDLVKHVPYFNTTFIPENDSVALDQRVQLCYVLPRRNLSLLPYKIYNQLHTRFIHYYPEKAEFEWSYCRYFWEAHPKLPEIDISQLESLIM